MTQRDSIHDLISDEQFSDLLAGRPSAETLANLNADDAAAIELADLKSALQNYRTETLVWAERRAATAPSLAPAARRSRVWAAVPQWSLAAVAMVSVAAGAVHFAGNVGDDVASTAAPVTVASAPMAKASTENIASDNELLTSIDAALHYGGNSPVDGLGLKPAAESVPRHDSNIE